MQLYYNNFDIKIFLGDSRDIPMDWKPFDLTITSPPYNMNTRVDSKRRYISRQVTKEFSTKYTGYSDNLHPHEYYDLVSNVLKKCLSYSEKVFWNMQLVTGNKPSLFRLMGEFSPWIKELVVWSKNNPQPAMNTSTLNSAHELILVMDTLDPSTRQFNRSAFARGTMSNVWEMAPAKAKKGHGATYPEELVKNCLSLHNGNRILDPFMGRGTTLVVAKSLQKEAVGVEISERDCEEAARRIEATEVVF